MQERVDPAGTHTALNVPSILRRAAGRGGRYARLLWRRHLLGQRYVEQRVHNYRMMLDSRDPGLSRQLLLSGVRELEQKFILESELRRGMTVFDLGANLGYYTVMMAGLVGPEGRVYAVEPVESNFSLLEQNTRLNRLQNVHAQRLAIADVDGAKALHLTPQSNWHSFHRPDVDASIAWLRKYERKVIAEHSVPTRTLSTYLSDKPQIDLMRMDIEGYEIEILRSLRSLPRAATERLHVLFETHPEFYGEGDEMYSVLDALRREHALAVKYLVSDFQWGSRRYPAIEPAERIFARRGYRSGHIVKAFRNRAIYAGIAQPDAIDLICRCECVNAALLAPM
jgi:FkbM family methyltransferase